MRRKATVTFLLFVLFPLNVMKMMGLLPVWTTSCFFSFFCPASFSLPFFGGAFVGQMCACYDSLFSLFMITRVIVMWWLQKRREENDVGGWLVKMSCVCIWKRYLSSVHIRIILWERWMLPFFLCEWVCGLKSNDFLFSSCLSLFSVASASCARLKVSEMCIFSFWLSISYPTFSAFSLS